MEDKLLFGIIVNILFFGGIIYYFISRFKRKAPNNTEQITSNIVSKTTSQTSAPFKFQDSFTKRHKAAMVTFLTFVASRGGLTVKDSEVLAESCSFLEINVNDSMIKYMLEKETESNLVKILATLNNSQRTWFVTALHYMAGTEGKVIPSKLTVAVDICERIGVSNEDYVVIVQNAHLINDWGGTKVKDFISRMPRPSTFTELVPWQPEVENLGDEMGDENYIKQYQKYPTASDSSKKN